MSDQSSESAAVLPPELERLRVFLTTEHGEAWLQNKLHIASSPLRQKREYLGEQLARAAARGNIAETEALQAEIAELNQQLQPFTP